MHVKLLNYSTPRGQDEFVEQVQKMKIFHEGPIRSGYVRPIISEWRVFDARLPEDKVKEFGSRLVLHTASVDGDINKDNLLSNARVLRWLIKLCRFCLRMDTIKVERRKEDHLVTKNWRYTFLIGTIKDPHQDTKVNGVKREVL